MIEEENLRYFITEEVFLMHEKGGSTVPQDEVIPDRKKTHDIVVWTHELTDKDQALLEKMLAAVKLSLDKVHLIHHEDEYTSHFNTLMSFGNVDFIADKADKEVLLNQPFHFESKSILVSYPISSLHTDMKKKSELWEGLKKLFRV